MDLNLDKIYTMIIPMDKFRLKSRFTEEKYNILPNEDLAQIIPLNEDANKILEEIIFESGLVDKYELNKKHLNSIIEFNLRTHDENQMKLWLDGLDIKPNEEIFLLWSSWGAAITKWEILKKYYDDFYYPVSDDLIIFDKYQNWILYFFHEEIIYFGRNK